MLHTLSRWQAVLLAGIAALLLAGALAIRPDPTVSPPAVAQGYSDLALYRDTAAAVAAGEGYEAAAVRLQRFHGFPTRPFLTVRLPTLTWAAALLGPVMLHRLLLALVLATAMSWYASLAGAAARAERAGAAALVLVGAAMAAGPEFAFKHELWAGLLVAMALVLQWRRRWLGALVLTAMAIAIRELAVIFALVCLAEALLGRRWKEAAAWAALPAALAIALWFHAAAVAAEARPGDLGSQGWQGLRGISAPLRDLVDVTALNRLPSPLAYAAALVALLGFIGAPRRLACLAAPLLMAIAVLQAIFARPVNFYWAILMLPTALIGLAFAPRTVRDVYRAIRRAPLAGECRPL